MAENGKIFVDSSKLPASSNEYVCWLDLMGTSSIMSQSLERATNFILRLHAAVLMHKTANISVYPMLDGVYLTTSSKKEIEALLQNVFLTLAAEFTGAASQHKFIPKAAIAYGPVVHGCQISNAVNQDIAKNKHIKDSILLGLPVIEANAGEKLAPPFGVFVDISARSFAPARTKPFPHVWWRWFNKRDKIRKEMLDSITKHYEWVDKNKFNQTYPADRIAKHKEMALEYFQ